MVGFNEAFWPACSLFWSEHAYLPRFVFKENSKELDKNTNPARLNGSKDILAWNKKNKLVYC